MAIAADDMMLMSRHKESIASPISYHRESPDERRREQPKYSIRPGNYRMYCYQYYDCLYTLTTKWYLQIAVITLKKHRVTG